MIEVMKKITVVCLDNAKEQTAKTLQSLGIVHVMDVVPPASQDLDALSKKQADLERILKAVPETLEPNQQGKIIVEYDATQRSDWGFVMDKVILSINGSTNNNKNILSISATIEEDFSNYSKEQLE